MEHLYIHTPFCRSKCTYCGLYSVVGSAGEVAEYAGALPRELEVLAREALIPSPLRPRTIYLGGGTPASLTFDGIRHLLRSLAPYVDPAQTEEWSVELHPLDATKGLLDALGEIGVNRISIGAQSFDDPVLRAMNRSHTANDIWDAVRAVKDRGFENLGLDLIAGLPGTTLSSWEDTLAQAVALEIKHLSIYALQVEPLTPLCAEVRGGLQIPDEETQLSCLALAEDVLAQAGFQRYEISNYALPGYECLHNLAVWRGGDYLGVGPSAASRIGCQRWHNKADVTAYVQALGNRQPPPRECETLTPLDDAMERVLFHLRLAQGIEPSSCAARFPVIAGRIHAWHSKLIELSRQKIVERHGAAWRLTRRGREVCDAVMTELL